MQSVPSRLSASVGNAVWLGKAATSEATPNLQQIVHCSSVPSTQGEQHIPDH